MIVKVKKISDSAQLPEFAKTGDAGADLRADESLVIEHGCRALVKCGFAIEIPFGYCGLVIPRSGLAAKHGITVLNSPGLIDSGYRGEICVALLNTDTENEFVINRGDRIAQLTILKLPDIEYEIADKLDESERGATGFGSSGVK